MNDLTKDELEDLLFCVKDHTGYQGDSIHENLIVKIQSMIDNYCEHVNNNKFNAIPLPGCIKMCVKCDKFFI